MLKLPFVLQGDGGPPFTYARLLHFNYCYVFLGGGGGVPSGSLCGGERCFINSNTRGHKLFSPRQSRSLFVPLGAGEGEEERQPAGDDGKGERRSAPRANYFA